MRILRDWVAMIVGGVFLFMAENKKSVLLYCDIIYTVEELDDVDAGLLFKHYLRYINDQNPEPPSKLIKIVFEPIKQNLKRDLKKWEQKSQKNSENAHIRWNKENANASERIKSNANHADKDTVNVIDKVKVNVNQTVNNNLVAVGTATIEQRELKFRDLLVPYIETYGKQMLREFFDYWTEKNEGGKKMRFEMQKVFDVKRRLVTWSKNNKFKGNGGIAKIISDTAERDELIRAKFAAQKSGSGNADY